MSTLLKVENLWKELAMRPELIGKEIVFDNQIGDTKDVGTIEKIMVEKGHVKIFVPEMAVAYAQERAWSPNIEFKIKDDREPQTIGDKIFCDLDERRQIRISLN